MNAAVPRVPPAAMFSVRVPLPSLASVILSLAVRVLLLAMVSVPVELEIVSPLTVLGVIAPRVNVRAGVVPWLATVALTPLAVVTVTAVTVPDPPPPPVAASTPDVSVKPDPIVIASNAPVPDVERPARVAVGIVRPLVVIAPLAAKALEG